MKYDITSLVSDSNSVHVAKSIGKKVVKKGSNYFILCNDHLSRMGKEDKHFGNCALTKNGYYCWGCGASGNIVQLVMKELNIDMNSACEIVGDITGAAKDYLLTNEDIEANKKLHTLSLEEVCLLGLENSGSIIHTINCTKEKEEVKDMCSRPKDDGENYLFCTEKRMSLNDLFKENRDFFNEMIINKALEGIQKREDALLEYCGKISPLGFVLEFGFKMNTLELQNGIRFVWEQEIRLLKDILKRFGYQQEINMEDEIPDLYVL